MTNGLSFASARPTPQPCVSVLVVWEIQEKWANHNLIKANLLQKKFG